MNSANEKEKKLKLALTKLSNLNFNNPAWILWIKLKVVFKKYSDNVSHSHRHTRMTRVGFLNSINR